MALLSACWLMIESIVIQDGFLKWSYMKLYMHPLVLFLCQLLLWLHLFFLWLLPPFKAFYNAFLSVLVTFSKLFNSFLRVIMVRRESTICNSESRQEITNILVNLDFSRSNIHNPVPAFSFSFKYQVASQLKVLLALEEGEILEEEEEDDDFFCACDQEDIVELLDATEGEEEEDTEIVMNMEKNLDHSKLQTMPMDQENENSLVNDEEEEENNDPSSLVDSDEINSLVSDIDSPLPLSIASLDSSLHDSIAIENQTHQDEDDETDEVYKKYCERMRWYDILGRDRTYGLSVIMNQETASSLNSSLGKTAEKRLKQSIEKDLELVYVAQSCLSWEALHHQYIIVRDSLEPADSRGRFYGDEISREFQKFQVLLERFLEDERCEGKRVWSFVQRRFELMSFFQVPRLSGDNREGPHVGEKERNDKKVLKAIEKCIEVFYDFVKVDIKRPLLWERLKISFVNSPLMELEDPRDIKLFLDLKNSLQKKEQLLKEIQVNKKKNWFKKKPPSYIKEDEIEKDENFMLVRFIMIDLKLVSRVLHMSLVSSSHLKWCQHKLNNIDFNGGKISRISSPDLFPSS